MSFHLLCLNTLQVLRQEFPSQPSKFYTLMDLHGRRSLVGYGSPVAKSRTRQSDFTFTFNGLTV